MAQSSSEPHGLARDCRIERDEPNRGPATGNGRREKQSQSVIAHFYGGRRLTVDLREKQIDPIAVRSERPADIERWIETRQDSPK
jgi:hypothetical protein